MTGPAGPTPAGLAPEVTVPEVTVHRAELVLPIASAPVRDGAVAVSAGHVVAVDRHDRIARRAALEGWRVTTVEWPGVLLPGLVNAHTHLQYTGMAEVGARAYTSFEHWSHAFEIVYERPHDWAADAALGARLALESGTTTVADVVTDPEAAGALHDAGLGGVAYWEVFAWSDRGWRAGGRDRTLARIGSLPAPPRIGLSPHAPYSLDTGVLRDLAALARHGGLRQHVHAAESAAERDYTRSGTGPLADAWRAQHADFALLRRGGSGLTPIGYLDSVGALGPGSHLAHGVYVDADDRRLLRARDTAVALCPRSNAVIGLDPAPVAAYLEEGNPICVGTDSLSSSPGLDVLGDVAALHRIARAQGYRRRDLHRRLLEAATVGGAHALGLDTGPGRVGVLGPGARADLAVFERVGDGVSDVVAALVEGHGQALATVVGGRTRWTRAEAGAGRARTAGLSPR